MLRGLVIGGSLWILLAACGGESGGCETSQDCDSGHICLAGTCVAQQSGCQSASDCPAGWICSDGACMASQSCTGPGTCPQGLICSDGVCVVDNTGCQSDADCEGGACDQATGTCSGGACAADLDCDDGDPCTLDLCLDGTCAHDPDPAAGCCDTAQDCVDINPCTTETCVEGRCAFETAEDCCFQDADCDDGDACTEERCVTTVCYYPVQTDPAACPCMSTADCDDGNPCTLDSCLSGACQYKKQPNSPSVECCSDDSSCDDFDDGTVDSCTDQFICNHLPKSTCATDTQCNDSNPCTDDLCQDGFCANDDAAHPDCCTADAQCDDGDPASVDACVDNTCQHADCESDADCDDGDPATVDLCEGQLCKSFPGCADAAACDDDDPCTVDECNASHQCQYSDVEDCCTADADCDDQDNGTIDWCEAGACVHQGKKPCNNTADCDDAFICSHEACVDGFCEYAPNMDEPACVCTDNEGCAGLDAPKPVVCGLFMKPDESGVEQVCMQEVGTKMGGQACASNAQCQTGFCMALDGSSICFGGCDDDLDCFVDTLCAPITFTPDSGADPFEVGACVPLPTSCAHDPDCEAQEVCAPGESLQVPNTIVGYCAGAVGTAQAGQTCSMDADCKSDWCVDMGLDTPEFKCAGYCASDVDCYGATRCYDELYYLIFYNGTPDFPSDDLYYSWPTCFPDLGSMQACAKDGDCPANEHCDIGKNQTMTAFAHKCRTDEGSGQGGASCSFDNQCKSGYCADATTGNGFCFGLCENMLDCAGASSCIELELTVNDMNTEDTIDDVLGAAKVCIP